MPGAAIVMQSPDVARRSEFRRYSEFGRSSMLYSLQRGMVVVIVEEWLLLELELLLDLLLLEVTILLLLELLFFELDEAMLIALELLLLELEDAMLLAKEALLLL